MKGFLNCVFAVCFLSVLISLVSGSFTSKIVRSVAPKSIRGTQSVSHGILAAPGTKRNFHATGPAFSPAYSHGPGNNKKSNDDFLFIAIFVVVYTSSQKDKVLYSGVLLHEPKSLEALKNGKFSKSQVHETFINALKRGDHEVVDLIREHQWNRIDLSDKKMNDPELISTCLKNGNRDIAITIKTLNNVHDEE